MISKISILFASLLCCIAALPSTPKTAQENSAAVAVQPVVAATPIDNVQLIDPYVITIEHFESLLRRASEIFNPSNFQLIEPEPVDAPKAQQQGQQSLQQQQQPPALRQQMQPPTEQPYNFYMPVFQYQDNDKLDDRSRKLEQFAPPPLPNKDQRTINYYAMKPKKQSKKFNAAKKQVNLNWVVDLEKQVLAGKEGQLTKAFYLVNDEKNRINFDDTFFGVDMQVPITDNEPHKEITSKDNRKEDDYFNRGEEAGEEDDLIAASSVQLPRIDYRVRKEKRV